MRLRLEEVKNGFVDSFSIILVVTEFVICVYENGKNGVECFQGSVENSRASAKSRNVVTKVSVG